MSLIQIPGLIDPRLAELTKLSDTRFAASFGEHNGKPFVSYQGEIGEPKGGLIIGPTGLDTLDGTDDHIFIPSSLGLGVSNNWSMLVGVTVPDTSRKGAFIKVGASTDGFGLGIGTNTIETLGNEIIGLKENVAWVDPNALIGTGFHTLAMFHRVESNGDNQLYFYIDGVYVGAALPSVPLAPSAETYIGGYNPGTNRHNTCPVHFALIGVSLGQGAAENDNPLIEAAGRLYPPGVWTPKVIQKSRQFWFGAASGPTLIELTTASFTWTKNPIQNRATATMSAPTLRLTGQSIQNRSTITATIASLKFTAQSIQKKATVALTTASLKFVAHPITVGALTTLIQLTTAAFNYSAKALQFSQKVALSTAALAFSPKAIQNRVTVTLTAATLSFLAKALQNKLTIALSVASFSFIAWAINVTGALASVVARLLTLLGVGS